MEDYMKTCIRKNNPDHVIIHEGASKLDFETTPERITESITDVTRNIKTELRNNNNMNYCRVIRFLH